MLKSARFGLVALFDLLLAVVLVLYLIGGVRIAGKLKLTYLHDLWIAVGALYVVLWLSVGFRFRETRVGRATLEAIAWVSAYLSRAPRSRLSPGGWVMVGTFLYSALIYLTLPILSHHAFGNWVFDLGIIENAIYNQATRGAFETFFISNGIDPLRYVPENRLNLGLYFFAIIYKFFARAEVLLFFQSLSILSAVVPIYLLGKKLLPKSVPAWAPVVLYLLWDPVYRINIWDFHEQPFMVSFALWGFYFLRTNRLKLSIFSFVLMSIWREDAWWTFAACMFYLGYRTKRWGIAAPWILIGLIVFPAHAGLLNKVNSVGHRYPYLGENLSQALVTALTKPWVFFDVIAKNWEFFGRLLLSGGAGVFLLGGWSLLPAIPGIAVVGLADHDGMVSWVNHYVFGFAGPLFYSAICGWAILASYVEKRPRLLTGLVGVPLAVALTQLSFNLTGALSMGLDRYRDMRCFQQFVDRVPADVPVLADEPLPARLARRHWIMRPTRDADQSRAQVLVSNDRQTLDWAGPWKVTFEACGYFMAERP